MVILLKLKSTGNSLFLLVINNFINFFSLTKHSEKFNSVLSIVISGFIAFTCIKTLTGLQKSSLFSLILNIFIFSSSNLIAAKLWKFSGIANLSLKLFVLFLLTISYSGLNVTRHPFSFNFNFVLHKNFIGI